MAATCLKPEALTKALKPCNMSSHAGPYPKTFAESPPQQLPLSTGLCSHFLKAQEGLANSSIPVLCPASVS